ncbi:MAG TPA: aldehyde dehydrogenase family protein [Nitriliruptorales bacterium]
MSQSTVPSDGAIVIPEATATASATAAQLDALIEALAARKDAWVQVDLDRRTDLLDRMIDDTVAVAEEWAVVAARAKGIAARTPADGEDMATGPLMLIRQLKLLRNTLRDLVEHGEVQLPGEPYERWDGQVAVPVMPASTLERAMFVGMSAEVLLRPHVTLETMQVGGPYRDKQPGRVCFVLGAGNISSIGASDCLHKLFAEDQVCILKMNPVNEHVGPYIEHALSALIDAGYLAVVYGGADVGSHLAGHELVDTLHMTGSDKTHDAIVYGVGAEGARRKAADDPVVDKPFTSELGNVTPIVVVPGPWSDVDIEYQAKHIVSMVVNNAGFNCGCPRVVVTHRAWARREQLLDAIRRCLAEAPPRDPYYPGAKDRWQVFLDAHPDAETFGPDGAAALPWTFLTGLNPQKVDDVAFRVEAFNGVFGEVALDAERDVSGFLVEATEFCNEILWGTLTATILVHPRSQKDPQVAAALDRALSDLRYGAIGVNTWGAVSYGVISTTWGAFPGHPRNDIQSGQGVVHNTFLLEDPEKTIVRSAWRLGKKPAMSYDFATFPQLIRRMIPLEAYDDWKQLPGIVLDGMRA